LIIATANRIKEQNRHDFFESLQLQNGLVASTKNDDESFEKRTVTTAAITAG